MYRGQKDYARELPLVIQGYDNKRRKMNTTKKGFKHIFIMDR